MTQISQPTLTPQPVAVCQRIVVGVDDTPSGLAALGWAVSQARRARAELVAVRRGNWACPGTVVGAVTWPGGRIRGSSCTSTGVSSAMRPPN